MLISVRSIVSRMACGALALGATCGLADAQGFKPDGTEYAIVGSYAGDQLFSSVGYSKNYGFVVWQDSRVDGKGFGIAARQLTTGFGADNSPAFRINKQGEGDQERPRVALFGDNSAVFTWQSSVNGKTAIFARFLSRNGTFSTDDIQISPVGVAGDSIDVSVSVLASGDAIIVWSTLGLDGDLQGVFGRLVKANGSLVGDVFRINDFFQHNQRNPEVAALRGGGFAVAWVSEQQRFAASATRGSASVDIYARVFQDDGRAAGPEIRVNSDDQRCDNPAISATADGGWAVAWSQKNGNRANGWDIYARWQSASGAFKSAAQQVNTFLKGDQFIPSISVLDERVLIAWTSVGQDGSREGVEGQLFRDGVKVGNELQVNTWTQGRQSQPTVAADGVSRFAVLWSSFVGAASYDLHAQRYSLSGSLAQPEAPSLAALSQSALQTSWPEVLGYPLDHFELAVDGAAAISTKQITYNITGLAPASTHRVKLRYVLSNGDQSPWSEDGIGITWGADDNFDGLPDDWQAKYWGTNGELWPAGSVDSDGDGVSNAKEFLAGTDPLDKASVLKLSVERVPGATKLTWNTVPGYVYQVQFSEGFPVVWQSLGAYRFARSTSETLVAPHEHKAAIYRVIRLR